jgi:hypothetical protein
VAVVSEPAMSRSSASAASCAAVSFSGLAGSIRVSKTQGLSSLGRKFLTQFSAHWCWEDRLLAL